MESKGGLWPLGYKRGLNPFLIALSLLTLLYVLLNTAWLCDDAYITLRTIDNFVHGFGLRWNISERVQTYTHPLWMALLTVPYFFFGNAYVTTIASSVIVSFIAVALALLKVANGPSTIFFGTLLFVGSGAFIDYSTSGLENPLNHLLAVLFFLVLSREPDQPTTQRKLGLIAGLAALNRLDTVLLFAPAVLGILFANGLREVPARSFRVAFGALPLLLWFVFSIFYYGFPFPNTAYAKLGGGISASRLIEQGLKYLEHSLALDPLTPIIIFFGILIPWVISRRGSEEGRKVLRPLSLGILLYLLYVVRIGGDFMAGRFLSTPYLFSCLILISLLRSYRRLAWLCSFALVFGLVYAWPIPNLVLTQCPEGSFAFTDDGIVNERCAYYFNTGLPIRFGKGLEPEHQWVTEGLEAQRSGGLVERYTVGFFGYYAGPTVHVLDRYALGDALLARLPAIPRDKWRPGHLDRNVPAGYPETIISGSDRFVDRQLAEYYRLLALLIRAPLFSIDRLEAFYKFYIGSARRLAIGDRYVGKAPIPISIESLSLHIPAKTPFEDSRVHKMLSGGFAVDLGRPLRPHWIDLSADGNDVYQIEYRLKGRIIRRQRFKPVPNPEFGLARYVKHTPAKVLAEGTDEVIIRPLSGDGHFGIGHLILGETDQPLDDRRKVHSE